jgi:hypothetical protein
MALVVSVAALIFACAEVRLGKAGSEARELRFPRCDLIGVDVELFRKLSQRFARQVQSVRLRAVPQSGSPPNSGVVPPRLGRALRRLSGSLRQDRQQLEQIANELAGTFSNHDAVWLCNTLQACCKARRFAYYCLLLGSA